MKPDGGPVYPAPAGTALKLSDVRGMSLRDYFAGQALAECIRVAADQMVDERPMLKELFGKAVAYAYFAADAMIAERVKE